MEKIGPGWLEITDDPTTLPPQDEYDWVLVKIRMIPEGYYGAPKVAEHINGKWSDGHSYDIESDYSIKVTHWRPIPED